MDIDMPPVVLVHGFWHGSWCWNLITEELAHRGIASVAVDLEGHGLNSRSPSSRWSRPFINPDTYATEPSPTTATTATSAAATLAEQLRRIGRGGPCVLVAHSMGGVVATLVAEQAPELVSEIVFVAAFAPVGGVPCAAYFLTPEQEGSLVTHQLCGDPAVIGALRYDTGDHDQHDVIRQTFFNDVDPVTAQAAIALLTPDGPAGIAGEAFTVTRERFGSIPRTYVVCMQDNVVWPALQRRMIAEIDAVSTQPTTVIELDCSHSPFLSQPIALADAIQARRVPIFGSQR